MTEWNIIDTDKYQRDLRWYKKKRPNELIAVLNNLDTYVAALNKGVKPMQIQGGFIHVEPEGIKALDQKGSSKVKLEQTRLYIYADEEKCELHLLGIGSKTGQREDIQVCREKVREIKSERG